MTVVRSRPESGRGRLAATLRSRHVSMIGLGGTIGTGIFVGSGRIISTTGPAIVLSYLVAGLLGAIVMRMLGALTANDPSTASFAKYAGNAFGSVGGFTIGWLYWWLMVVTVGVELGAATSVAHAWTPGVPVWAWGLALMLVFTIANLAPTRVFGESQFWFAGLKVVALALVVLCGVVALCGLIPGVRPPGLVNILDRGGIFPTGGGSVVSGILVAVFSFIGVEMIAIAGSETRFPKRTLRPAITRVLVITMVLYVAALAIVVTMVPWNSPTLAGGTFGALFAVLHMPAATDVINVLIFVTVLSCLNSCLFAASRMVYALAGHRDAPRPVGRLAPRGVPSVAVLLSALIGFGAFAVQYVLPSSVFLIVVDSSGAVGLLVWLTIAGSYLRTRAQSNATSEEAFDRRRGFPVLSVVAIVLIVLMLIGMCFLSATQPQILATMAVAVLILVIALWRESV